ncbi:uncharacterized protein [Linepithema humile]|uniref:uncharacterized protein n=1 Tax=Linepithema humile TaxID=83485 RepID=UPI00351F0C5C
MNEDISCGFEMPYLQAIQKLPGDTASEKFRWIGKLASDEPNAIENHEKVSTELLPLLRVEVAVKHKRHEDITSALISNVSTIVSRALKASWFFDGRHENVNVAYFCKQIFPFVSPCTRNRIVKTLSRRIQNPVFAQEMFMAVTSTYDTEIALPLLLACNDVFIFQTVNKMSILLPYKIFKKIFQKNLRLGKLLFEFFVFSYQKFVPQLRNVFDKYRYFLPKLMKNYPSIYVRISAFNLGNPSHKYMLSNTCAKRFLQAALEHVIRNLESYYTILPKKIFNAILVKKFPYLVNNPLLHGHYRNELLNILLKHPEERYLKQHLKTYRDICNNELVDIENVTPHILRLLPAEKRIQLAKEKINSKSFHEMMDWSREWICYLPAKKATAVMKLRFNQESDFRNKLSYILKMMYACEVNNDENELYNTLKYIIDKKYMISYDVEADKEKLFRITEFSKPLYLSERNACLVYHIIKMFYEQYGYVEQDVLDIMILYGLVNDKSIENLIEILRKTFDNHVPISFTHGAFRDYPHHERQFLVTFLIAIEQLYADRWRKNLQQKSGEVKKRRIERKKTLIGEEESKNGEKYVLYRLVVAMYDFNEKCKKFGLEHMSIKNYPCLMNAIRTIMHVKTNFSSRTMRILLHKYEPELYRSWFLPDTSKNIADVTSGAALRLLKQDSQSVLDNWEEYLIDCKRHYRHKHVQRFVRATRWYKDIPIKFAERCISDLHEEDTKEMPSALIILSFLLDTNSLTKLINMNSFIFHLASTMEKHKFFRMLDIIKFHKLPFVGGTVFESHLTPCTLHPTY